MIRLVETRDAQRLSELLYQVHAIHADLRPDLFVPGEKKFSDQEIIERIEDKEHPIFVYEDEAGLYVFCNYIETKDKPNLVARKELFIDDLCVDASQRGKGVGELLYRHVVKIAKENGCKSVTLHVWSDNAGAVRFYERLGMQAQYVQMEQVLE